MISNESWILSIKLDSARGSTLTIHFGHPSLDHTRHTVAYPAEQIIVSVVQGNYLHCIFQATYLVECEFSHDVRLSCGTLQKCQANFNNAMQLR